ELHGLSDRYRRMFDDFVKLPAFHELHTEVALPLSLAHLVDGNDGGMIEACSSFGFQTEALQVRVGGPLAKANNFYCNNAIEILLSGPIYHALTAPADFLQQLIVTQVPQHRGSAYSRFRARLRFHIGILDGTAVIRLRRSSLRSRFGRASGYGGRVAIGHRFVRGDAERCFQHATHAKSFRGVRKDFRAALSANSNYGRHIWRNIRSMPERR